MMRKNVFFSLILAAICFAQTLFAQTIDSKNFNSDYFDEKAAYEQAKTNGIKASDINGYVQFLKNNFSSKKALEKQVHKHSPYENAENINEKIIYINGNKTSSIGCPNAGFENYDFTGWTGEYGSYGGNETVLTYSLLPGIINTAGVNISLQNTTNYQTILTVPPTNPAYPNCVGYDSIACPSGGPLISQIPFISPFSLDGVSCRMLGAYGGSKVSKLKYIMGVSSSNKQFRYSYAIVLNDGHPPGNGSHQPYFKVTVKDQNGNPIVACQTFSVDATGALSDTTFRTSHLLGGSAALPLIYRPWHLVSIDLSSPIYASVTSISIEFEVAGCNASGHIGYAYVDAECAGGGISAAYCSGTNAVLTAPIGFTNYQWYDNNNLPIAAPTGTNSILTVTAPVVGNVYSVSMATPGGCSVTVSNTIGITNVSISNINSAPSCAGGNSGIATVVPAGSTGVYSYTWTSISTGSVVSNSQTATGLATGNYSVLVSSPTCGQASANLSVGVSPPFFFSQSKPFCGNATTIIQPNGSNYTWYHNSTIIPAPFGTNDTLKVDVAVAGDIYTVVYKNAQGCKDSLAYVLHQISGGNVYFSNISNVCPNDSNGSIVLNLNTPFSAPYNYFVTGPNNSAVVIDTTTSLTSVTLSPLVTGTYSSVINDGVCIYNNTFNIGVIQTNFTVTPTNNVLCFPEEVTLNLEFGTNNPTSCGFDASLCSGPPTQLFTTGTFTNNSSSNYPTPFSGWWYSGKHQFLITASDLIASGISAGKISSLAFKITALNTSPLTYPDYQIKMGCTSLNSLPTGANQPFVTGLTTVYFNPSQPISLGWLTHNFSQSYVWDGVSNIIVEVCTGGLTTFPANASIELKQMPYVCNMKSISTSNGVSSCPQINSNSSGSYMTNGENMLPNMRFGYCSSLIPSSDYTVAVSSNGTITNTYANDSITVAPTFITPPVGTGSVIYTISVINPIGGCVGTNTVEIFYPPLTTTVTTIISDSTLCEGDNTTLTASGASTYNWYYQSVQGGSLTPISGSSSINVIPPSIGTNTYVVTGNAPCASSVPDTNTVRVYITQKANLLITSLPDVTKCLNKAFTLLPEVSSTTLGNPGTPYSYSWTTLPGNIPAPGNNTDSSYIETSNSTTTLVVTVNGVCAHSKNDTVVVNNFVDDLSIYISNADTTCPNKPFTLNSNVSGGHPLFNYTWAINSNTISNTANLTYTSPSTGGTYSVEVTVIDSCSYQKSDVEVIYVLPNTLNITIIDSVSLCGNTAFELHSISSGGYSDYNYQWYLMPNTNSISYTSGLSYTTPPTEGIYTLQVVIADSCGYQQSDFQVINVLPPCQVEIPNVITPNGDNFNDFFKINNLEYHPNTNLTIFDRWGKKVYENPNYNNEWKADGVSDGTYFYVIVVPEDKSYSGFVTVFKEK